MIDCFVNVCREGVECYFGFEHFSIVGDVEH